jgi:hypothetical protein
MDLVKVAVIRTQLKRRLVSLLAACVATSLGVAINVATDLASSIWAWLAVVVLTAAGFAVGVGIDKVRHSKSTPKLAETPQSSSASRNSKQPTTATQYAHGQSGVAINIGKGSQSISVQSPASGIAIISVGAVTMIAMVIGLTAGANVPTKPTASAATSTTPSLEGVLTSSSPISAITSTRTPTSSETVPAAPPPPLQVRSVAYMPSMGQGSTYGFPRPLDLSPTELATASSFRQDYDKFHDWAHRHSGVTANEALLQVVVANTTEKVVVITDIVINKKCSKPLTGMLMYAPPAGSNNDLQMKFDLDAPTSLAHAYETGEDLGLYFGGNSPKTISVAPNTLTTLGLHAITWKQYCHFSFTVKVTGEANTTVPINDHGDQFEVTATPAYDGSGMQFSAYSKVYAGGVASPEGDGNFHLVDPKTFTG